MAFPALAYSANTRKKVLKILKMLFPLKKYILEIKCQVGKNTVLLLRENPFPR